MARRERMPNPHSNATYAQEELDRMAVEHAAYEAELEESYLEARETRIAQQEAEREEWREERRNARIQEWVDRTGRSVVDYPYGGIARR